MAEEGRANDPPPSYNITTESKGNIFDQLKAAKTDSSSATECCGKACAIILGSIWCTIVTGVFLLIPISMIVVGAVFLKACRYERYIPIYLIVGGVFTFILNIYRLVHSALGGKTKEGKRGLPFEILIGLFLFCWFIAGNVWIYSIYRTVEFTNNNSTNYCNKPLYLYSFWITTLAWIFFIISLLCGCLCGCISACICEPK